MTTLILTTKLYVPPVRPELVSRSRLIDRLNEGLHRKLTLVCAPAGFGKTTLVSDWVAGGERPVAWLALDDDDNDPIRFMMYLVTTLKTVAPQIGNGVMMVLQSPQVPPVETILTALLNDIAIHAPDFMLVLDDYHLIDAPEVDYALGFLLDHLPPRMHLVIATRQDPPLPLARLRARGQLTELRVTDLRFTPAEVAQFLNTMMGLNLSEADIAALETRTEGWIAGLQLAALSMQGHHDTADFIKSFTGSHRFVLDYLVEEVLHQQPQAVQSFLLKTAILNRLCASLCDAVLQDDTIDADETLQHIDRANLFIMPLDNERRWYRYHHLFAELLRQRLHSAAQDDNHVQVAELHRRASIWFEANALHLEAFQHAVAAEDVDRAARLVEGDDMPLIFRGAAAPVLNWLQTLPAPVLDARPGLRVLYASALIFVGRLNEVEAKAQAAERVLEAIEQNDHTRDLIGHIASIRATVAVTRHDADIIMAQTQRALDHIYPHNVPVRAASLWTLGYAHQLQGNRAAAVDAYQEAVNLSETIGHIIIAIAANIGLGSIQELNNQLRQAVETYQALLKRVGDPPFLIASEIHLGLARIYYEWNDLQAVQHHIEQARQLSQRMTATDRTLAGDVLLARVKWVQGDVSGAAALLRQAAEVATQGGFTHQLPDIVAVQVRVLLHQGDMAAANDIAQAHDVPLSQVRVQLAQGDNAAALTRLQALRQQAEANHWPDEQLRVMVLQALAHHASDNHHEALSILRETLTLAQAGGFMRLFVDEGQPMRQLLLLAAGKSILPDYVGDLLAAFDPETLTSPQQSVPNVQPLIEPLTEREFDVLRLIAEGLSNREIGERLFLALDTVKGHNRRIFAKLDVQRRTEAVARARELGLL